MAYDQNNLSHVFPGGEASVKAWYYVTTDSIVDVMTAGYFEDPKKLFRAGERIDISVVDDVSDPLTSTSFARVLITSVGATGIPVLQDETGTPADNTINTAKLTDNAVTNAKMAEMPTLTIKGNNTGVSADPSDLTVDQVEIMLEGRRKLLVFNTRAEAEAYDIPPEINRIRILGRNAANDGGGVDLARVGSEPTHNGKLTSNDGAFWVFLPDDDNCLRARCFGGTWDNVADDTSALQDCHDAALALRCDMRVNAHLVRASNFRIGSSTGFVQPPNVYGLGDTHNADTGISGPGTIITAHATTHPVIVIEGARRPKIKGLAFKSEIDTSAYSASGQTPTLEATWTTVFGADSQYAPFCAIAIDPYLGTAPAGGYSGVTYHSFQSSHVEIEDVFITGYPVGIAVQPCDADANGDFVTFRSIDIHMSKYGVSLGNGQSRNVGGFKFNGANLHTIIATNVHGRQVGSIRGHFDNCSFGGYIGRIFSIGSVSTAGPFGFTSFFAENLHRIGDFSGNTSERAISFRDSTFNFRHVSQGIHPAQVMGDGAAPVYFTGCLFTGYDKMLSFLADNCIWNGATASYPTDTTDTDLQAATHGLISGVLSAPNSRHDLYKNLAFVDYYSSPTAETRNATGVSVSGLTVTFATAGSFVTYPVGSLMRDRVTGTLMLRASETTATLLTNHDETDIIESLSATMNTDWLVLP